MVYITGDIHGGIDIEKLSGKHFPQGKQLTRQDYVLICGDFGLPFLPTDSYPPGTFLPNKYARSSQKTYLHWCKWLSQRPYTILWVDGNHDNHPFWYDQPVTEWNGGKVNIHPLAENVIHLKRGEYYKIDGHTFWTMGGAASHDREYRIDGYSWWKEEIPSAEEMQHGQDTLAAHGNQVDFIITHTMPQCLIAPALSSLFPTEPTREYLTKIYRTTAFRYWFCGHLHIDKTDRKHRLRVSYNEIVPLEQFMLEPVRFSR